MSQSWSSTTGQSDRAVGQHLQSVLYIILPLEVLVCCAYTDALSSRCAVDPESECLHERILNPLLNESYAMLLNHDWENTHLHHHP